MRYRFRLMGIGFTFLEEFDSLFDVSGFFSGVLHHHLIICLNFDPAPAVDFKAECLTVNYVTYVNGNRISAKILSSVIAPFGGSIRSVTSFKQFSSKHFLRFARSTLLKGQNTCGFAVCILLKTISYAVRPYL